MRSFVLTLFFLLLATRIFLTNKDSDSSSLTTTNTILFDPSTLATIPPLIKKGNEPIDTTALKKSDWYAQVTKSIEEKEYSIRAAGNARTWAAPNRQQALRALYTASKLTLQPRKENADKWKLQLSLQGIYAGKQKIYTPSADAAAEEKGNSILFHHHDEFTVEYINNSEGVRENFIVQKKPAGDHGQLSVELMANSGWFINKAHDREIHFAKTKNGVIDKKITYNSLKAWDASNKELDASFSVNANNISIIVNTAGAVYPVTIDPLSTTASWMIESNVPNVQYGTTGFSAGDVNGDGYSDVIVSAWDYNGPFGLPGAAFVYHGSATGLSTTAAWTVYTSVSGRIRDVSTAGDVNGDGYSDVLIGNETYNSSSEGGIVYIYLGSAAGLETFPDRTLSISRPNSSFGRPVTCAGDVNGDGFSDILIGAATYTNGQTSEGAAFLFYSGYGPAAWMVEGNQANASLGLRVNGAGDINGDGFSDVIVGALQYDNGETNEGKAWVYNGSATGLSATASWTAESNQANAGFGGSVASAGDVNGDGHSDIIIGAQSYDVGPNNVGAAFVYHGSAAGLPATPNTTLAGTINNGLFGWVSEVGDVNGDGYGDVLSTAPGANQAYVYYGSATGLPTTANWNVSGSGSFGNQGGAAGDINGDGYSDIIITANTYSNGQTLEGAAYVYNGAPNGLISTSTWNKESNLANGQMGYSVASAGDVNSDGFSDVIISAFQYTNGQTNEGAVFAYYGSAAGLPATANWTKESNQMFGYFGGSVACAGDVNGDGYSDIIIGAHNLASAFIYYGSASGLSLTTNWIGMGAGASFYGWSVSSAGDVNGDGYADVIVGARNENSFAGAAYVYYGSATGPSSIPDWIVNSPVVAQYGHCVSGAGDVNGDGYGDVIVGALSYNNGQTGEGAAFAYYGSATGLSTTANWMVEGNLASASLGYSVASAGDVNGDGFNDVIIGLRGYNNGQFGEGAARVYYGSTTGLPATASWVYESNQANAQFGTSVASAGDVNGDGYSDVIIGSPSFNSGTTGGRAFLFYGSVTGLPIAAGITIDGSQANSYMANAVASAGDVNGDGYSDILVGNNFYDNGETDEGRALFYHGNSNTGKRNNLRLYNPDLVTPMQRSTISLALFGAGLYARSPLGRQKALLVWETKKNGQPFSGTPITNSTTFLGSQLSFTDLGLTGAELKNQVAKELNAKATYVRARVKYNMVTALTGQVYGPWRYPESFLRGNRDMGAIILPVKFFSFTVLKQNNNALLRWVTTDETPGIRYEIQYSTDGIHFNNIKNIPGTNNSHNEYEWLHTNAVAGKNYYRLRAVENGREAYSAIRQLFLDSRAQVLFYPNPVKSASSLTIQLTGATTAPTLIVELFNSSGQKMLSNTSIPVNNIVTIKLPALSRGQYILKVMNKGSLLCSGDFVVM